MASDSKRHELQTGMTWAQIERASLAADRAYFKATTPGQRVAEMSVFIGQATALALSVERQRREGSS